MKSFLPGTQLKRRAHFIIYLAWLTASCAPVSSEPATPTAAQQTDARLQHAALAALGNRDGAIIVLDPQTGRIRAIAGEQVAYEQTLAPGSTTKPFTTLAALEASSLDADSRLVCRERFKRDGVDLRCSHPRLLPAFSPQDALAHSCNYFHATFGARLNASHITRKLTEFGFDQRTDPANAREATGAIPHDLAPASLATGEAARLRTTPVALLSAYLALANGGHLLTPQRSAADASTPPRERARISINASHRRIILDGMRGAITHGTAAAAELNALPFYIFGKTGTATDRDEPRPHGWFVAFAADEDFARDSAPARLRLAVLVVARDAHGSDAARLARPIFAGFARALNDEQATTRRDDHITETQTNSASHDAQPATKNRNAINAPVRLRLVRQARTLDLSLDDYIFGALAAEASAETELEALKAQAVVSRTYATGNLSRHRADGYDFCDLTHCQRFLPVRDRATRGEFYALVTRAVHETSGELLRDARGQIADTYFSASCGGHTANISDLWNVRPAPPHLRGITDAYCAHAAGDEWTDTLSRKQLLRALNTDPRSEVGASLTNVRVLRRDATGRAATIELTGARRRVLNGWTFKTIIGRTLGWNTLKSTRFQVERTADGFRFRGRGFGHGLGFCQTGAHRMASRGANYRAILNHYFPGATARAPQQDSIERQAHESSLHKAHATQKLYAAHTKIPTAWHRQVRTACGSGRLNSRLQPPATAGGSDMQSTSWCALHIGQFEISNLKFQIASVFPSSLIPHPSSFASPRRTLQSGSFRVSYPAHVPRSEVETLIAALERTRARLARQLAAAQLPVVTNRPLEVFIHATTGDFTSATGQPAWVAAATDGRRIQLQPLAVLRRRGALATAPRHEYTHVVIERLARTRAPRWLAEGLALHIAGEGRFLVQTTQAQESLTLDELERRINAPRDAAEMRRLYAEAYRRTLRLINEHGETRVWQRIAGR